MHRQTTACPYALNYLVLTLNLLLTTGGALAQPEVLTYQATGLGKVASETTNDQVAELRRKKEYKRVEIVQIHLDRLAEEDVTVTLPDGARHVFRRRHSASRTAGGSRTWVGTHQGGDYGTLTFAASADGERVVGTIHVGETGAERTLQIQTLEDGTKVLLELDPRHYNFKCGTGLKEGSEGRDQ